MLSTHLLGAIRVLKGILPFFRLNKSGTVVNMSSIFGQVAVPGNGVYSLCKFALEGASEALAAEPCISSMMLSTSPCLSGMVDMVLKSLRSVPIELSSNHGAVSSAEHRTFYWDQSQGVLESPPVVGRDTLTSPWLAARTQLYLRFPQVVTWSSSNIDPMCIRHPVAIDQLPRDISCRVTL